MGKRVTTKSVTDIMEQLEMARFDLLELNLPNDVKRGLAGHIATAITTIRHTLLEDDKAHPTTQ